MGRIRAEIVRGRPATAAEREQVTSSRRVTPPQQSDTRESASPAIGRLLEEWFLDLRVGHRRPNTIRSYREPWSLLLRRTGIITLDQLTATAVKSYLVALETEHGNRPGTVAFTFRAIRAFVSWCLDQEDLQVDRTLLSNRRGRGWFRVPAPKLDQAPIEAYRGEQLQALERMCRRWSGTRFARQHAINMRYLAFMRLLWGTGIRLEEALALELDDLKVMESRAGDDGDAHAFIWVRKSKSRRSREVPISDRLHKEIYRYINRYRGRTPSTRLFVDEVGEPLRYRAVQHFFALTSRRVGFRVHAHRFRHTWATDYLRTRPNDIERLRRIGGWSDYAMVTRYVHHSIEDLGRGWQGSAPY